MADSFAHGHPKDDATLLVYSDWLEEQGDPASAAKAEFLRVTVKPAKGGKEEKARSDRLQALAATLDTDWLGVVSRMQIENCLGKRREDEKARAQPGRGMRALRFEFLCDRKWEDLRATDDQGVRFCDGCQQGVHYCDTITAAREHARQGHCVAVDLGVIRRDRDLSPIRMLLAGRVSPEHLREQQEREAPDPVSAERQRRKREKS